MRRSARQERPTAARCTDVEARGRVQAPDADALRGRPAQDWQARVRLPDADDALHADSCRRGCMLLSHAGDLRANALGGHALRRPTHGCRRADVRCRGRRQAGQHLDTLASGRRRTGTRATPMSGAAR
ncbi:hypothetical protein AXF42_Ash006546 [Apostasia shenzhenica]|uniref:Uncharacterized protein n=1 Tax=Apostasia shenzhenica TaxID=1088818 RepID=A0A2I0AZE0_9ASPA|nr:hypothetical protein AXF42_Ash006546 [Apostasia shenzhenica]